MRESTHTHEWDRFILRGRDFYEAARFASKEGWWLHCWKYEHKDDILEVVDTYHGTVYWPELETYRESDAFDARFSHAQEAFASGDPAAIVEKLTEARRTRARAGVARVEAMRD